MESWRKTDEKFVFVSERNLVEADPLFTMTISGYSVAGPDTTREHAENAAKTTRSRRQKLPTIHHSSAEIFSTISNLAAAGVELL